MGTAVSVTIDLEIKEAYEKHYKFIEDTFDFYHVLADNETDKIKLDSNSLYQLTSENNVYKINSKIASSDNLEETFEVQKELYELVYFGLLMEQETVIDGVQYFSISLGNIIDKWKSVIREKNDLTQEEINDKINKIKSEIEKIEEVNRPIIIKEAEGKYFLTIKKGAKIDLGALAKGYALELVRKYLEEQKVTSYLISAGSSSMIMGSNYKKTSKKYLIGLVDPLKTKEYYGTVELENNGITTSGNHEQFVEFIKGDEKQIYHHIVSPKEKMPLNYYHTVTLISKDVAKADALTTAMFNMPKEVLDKFIKENQYEVIYYENNERAATLHINTDKYQFKWSE